MYYRPISNLTSLSKVFERCVLHRLELQTHLYGEHQHGFRTKHSTTTAMMEIRSELARSMDDGLCTAIYNLDMSAAFDLLRPDSFSCITKDKLEPGLSRILLDFLCERKYIVRVGEKTSSHRSLDCGCVQGSVLGPSLFSIYCGGLQEAIGSNVWITSYADDTYVIVAASTQEELTNKLTTTLKKHLAFLEEIGMVVDTSKTEIMFMKHRHPTPKELVFEGQTMKILSEMKVLGITFDWRLKWNIHVDNLIK